VAKHLIIFQTKGQESINVQGTLKQLFPKTITLEILDAKFLWDFVWGCRNLFN
jgi:hypothetical protein